MDKNIIIKTLDTQTISNINTRREKTEMTHYTKKIKKTQNADRERGGEREGGLIADGSSLSHFDTRRYLPIQKTPK